MWQVTCASDGTVSAALFLRNGCQVLGATGSGVGDGVACVPLRMVDGSGVWGGRVDCSAPGPDPSLSSGALAGIIIGAVAGVALLLGGGWWYYRSYKTAKAVQLQGSIHMQQQQPYAPKQLHYLPPTAGAQQLPPGAMMALVCCLALLAP